jgi:hypothetical protein
MHASQLYTYIKAITNFCLILGLISLSTSCKRIQPTKEVLGAHCLGKIKNYFKKRPLSILEQRFFTDRKSHDVLKVEQLNLERMEETSTSATIIAFQLNFSFKDPITNKPITLHNTDRTGGVSLRGPNQVTYRIRCSASWNLFKSKVIQERLSIKQINLNRWQIEMNQLTTGFDLMKGESELR